MAASESEDGSRGPGGVAEFGPPGELLQNPEGVFTKLVLDSGLIVDEEILKLKKELG